VTNTEVASCVTSETFSQWVSKATLRTNGPIPNSTLTGVTGTPTVLVNGIQYTGAVDDAAAFSAFVTAIATGTYEAPTN
jgi:hypothetical protein